MKTGFKKILSMLLVLTMLLSMTGITAMATAATRETVEMMMVEISEKTIPAIITPTILRPVITATWLCGLC